MTIEMSNIHEKAHDEITTNQKWMRRASIIISTGLAIGQYFLSFPWWLSLITTIIGFIGIPAFISKHRFAKYKQQIQGDHSVFPTEYFIRFCATIAWCYPSPRLIATQSATEAADDAAAAADAEAAAADAEDSASDAEDSASDAEAAALNED